MTRILVAAVLACVGVVPQERTSGTIPQKGDTIVVKGCLRGSSLESTETGLADSEGRLPTGHVYRLTGNKNTLKVMRKELEGYVIEATGILKSTLLPSDETGRTFGNTRVRIGVPNPGSATPNSEANRSIPVLEVKTYEGSTLKCG